MSTTTTKWTLPALWEAMKQDIMNCQTVREKRMAEAVCMGEMRRLARELKAQGHEFSTFEAQIALTVGA